MAERLQGRTVEDLPSNDLGFENPAERLSHVALSVAPGGNALAGAVERVREENELSEFMDAEDEVNRLLAEAGGGSRDGLVTILKHTANGKEWCERKAASVYRPLGQSWIARTFGPGEYELMIYNGERRLVGKPRFIISKAVADYHKAQYPADTPAPVVSNATDGMEKIAAIMAQGFAQLGQLIVQQKAPAGNDEEAFIRKMTMYKELFSGGQQTKSNDPFEMIDHLVKLNNLIDRKSGGGGERSTLEVMADVAREFAPAIGEAIKSGAFKMSAANPAPVAGALPAPADKSGTVQADQPNGGDMNVLAKMALKSELGKLVACAEKNKDPQLYAELLYDQLDQIPEQFVQQFFRDPNWLQWLATFEPRVAVHGQWFTAMRAALIEIVQEEAANAQQDNGLTPPPNSGSNGPEPIIPGADNVLFGNDIPE